MAPHLGTVRAEPGGRCLGRRRRRRRRGFVDRHFQVAVAGSFVARRRERRQDEDGVVGLRDTGRPRWRPRRRQDDVAELSRPRRRSRRRRRPADAADGPGVGGFPD